MSITINAKGTSVPFFTIGKNGTTLYQGTIDPSLFYSVKNGDLWVDPTENTLLSWSATNSAWQAPKISDLSFVANSIVAATSEDLTLKTSAGNKIILDAGSGSPIITSLTGKDLHITEPVGGDLYLNANRWPAGDGSAGQCLITDGNGVSSWSGYQITSTLLPQATNLLYVSSTSISGSNPITPNGSSAAPFTTIQAAIDFATSTYPVTSDSGVPVVIVVSPGTYAENITVTRPLTHIEGFSGRQKATFISGTVTITPSVSYTNSYSASYITLKNIYIASGSGNALSITGTNKVGVILDNTGIWTSSGKAITISNTASGGNKFQIFNSDVNSGNTIEFSNLAVGLVQQCVFTCTGTGNGISTSSSALTIDALIAETATASTLIKVNSGTLNIGNSTITSTTSNGTGFDVSAGATLVAGQNAFNVVAGTGKAVYGVTGSVFMYALNMMVYGTNQNISSAMTSIPMSTTFTSV